MVENENYGSNHRRLVGKNHYNGIEFNAINIGVTYFDFYASLNRKLGTVLSSTYISNLRYSSLHKAQVSFDGFQSICCPF